MTYWMLNWCTMAAGTLNPMCSWRLPGAGFVDIIPVGLVMESLFTLIGLKWAGYFLSFCGCVP